MKRKASGLIFVCMAMATVLGVAGCGGKDNHELRLVEGKVAMRRVTRHIMYVMTVVSCMRMRRENNRLKSLL